jgi:hypothetical protein
MRGFGRHGESQRLREVCGRGEVGHEMRDVIENEIARGGPLAHRGVHVS